MLRLDPGLPPLWRSHSSLQFGIDAIVVLDDPEPWQERLVHELVRGVPDDAFEAVARVSGATAPQARALLRQLRAALVQEPARGPVLTLQTAENYPVTVTDQIARALASAGWRVVRATWYGASDEAPPGAGPVIVVTDHLVEPRRAAPLMARDISHLPVIFTGGRVEIGPLIVPGKTACLACIGAHRRDADPTWPLIAAQLVGKPGPEVDGATATEAGLVAARMLTEAGGPPRVAHSLILFDDSLRRTWRAHRPHEECLCRLPERRSPARTATAIAPAVPLREPMTSTAFARPA